MSLIFPNIKLTEIDASWRDIPLLEREELMREWNRRGLPAPVPTQDALVYNKKNTLNFLLNIDPAQVFFLARPHGIKIPPNATKEQIIKILLDASNPKNGKADLIYKIWLQFVPVLTPANKNTYEIRLVRDLDYFSRK